MQRFKRFVREHELVDPPAWALKAAIGIGGEHTSGKPQATYTTTGRGYVPSGEHLQSQFGNYGGWGPYDAYPFVASEEDTPPSGGMKPHDFPVGPWAAMRDDDAEALYQRALKRRKKKLASKPSAKKVIPAGNLREGDYRFWRGQAVEGSTQAECRWCGRYANTTYAREMHEKNGNECKARLMALYKWAALSYKNHVRCFVCCKEGNYKRWGVPLCNTPACLGRWKFFQVKNHLGMQQYRNWAMDAVPSPFSHLGEDKGFAAYTF
jgi:hypothetical protein